MQDALLIGLGNIGMGYDLSSSGILAGQTMSHLKALTDSEFYSVCGVMDAEDSKLSIAKKFYSVRAVSDLKQIKPTKVLSLLTIATPTQTHMAVLESLPDDLIPKILLIEKPAGSSLQECLRIAQWAKSNSILVFVNYFRRYLPEIKKAREFVSELELGRLLSVSINSYGSLLNIFSHFMDLGVTVTGHHLFCSCPKSNFKKVGSDLLLECIYCRVQYSFYGVGHSRMSSQSRICFENYQIDIDADGRKILISESNGDDLVSFKTPDFVFSNYQRIVYAAIMSFSEDTHFLEGMNQAIGIHKFLESLRTFDDA